MWSKEVPVDDGEDTGIDANGSRESRDDDERNDRVAADEAETVPEVIEQAIEKSSVVDGFGDFAGQGFGDSRARSGEMEMRILLQGRPHPVLQPAHAARNGRVRAG